MVNTLTTYQIVMSGSIGVVEIVLESKWKTVEQAEYWLGSQLKMYYPAYYKASLYTKDADGGKYVGSYLARVSVDKR